MDKIYVIIYGLRTCPDCDELIGYVDTEEQAKTYCDSVKHKAENGYRYMYEEVEKLL